MKTSKLAKGDRAMSSADENNKKPIGDPPARKQPVRADQGTQSKQPSTPMMDPFTDQRTHPAGDGQGANAPQQTPEHRNNPRDDGDDEEVMPIEEGFSPVP
jgi:hypothetical protein